METGKRDMKETEITGKDVLDRISGEMSWPPHKKLGDEEGGWKQESDG